jgi:hypothetical protein
MIFHKYKVGLPVGYRPPPGLSVLQAAFIVTALVPERDGVVTEDELRERQAK